MRFRITTGQVIGDFDNTVADLQGVLPFCQDAPVFKCTAEDIAH